MNAMPRPEWRNAPEIEQLVQVFAAAGEPLFFVGGCVRDALMGRAGGDVDMATPVVPERVQGLLAQAGIATVPTGLAHGTITAILPRAGRKSRPVEITTFRRDVDTDGRHATVAYSANMEEDAARRDFTMNALYLSPEGALFDPTSEGVQDAEARRLRFVGEPARRIAEDGLRLLRFWRFAAQLELPEDRWDAPSRAACARAAESLAGLSGERLQAEMRKLLCAPAPAKMLEGMRKDGVAAYVIPQMGATRGLDGAANLEALLDLPPQFVVRLAYLMREGADAAWVAHRWRLSNADRARLLWLLESPAQSSIEALKTTIRRRGREDGLCLVLWQALQADASSFPEAIRALRDWTVPVFPLKGSDLLALGHAPGPQLGVLLDRLEREWEEGGYLLNKPALLQHAKDAL